MCTRIVCAADGLTMEHNLIQFFFPRVHGKHACLRAKKRSLCCIAIYRSMSCAHRKGKAFVIFFLVFVFFCSY